MYLLNSPSSVISALKHEEIIPTMVSDEFTPAQVISIVYPSGKEVLFGNVLTPEEAREEPVISLTPMHGQSNKHSPPPSYTLIMADPDAPSRADPKRSTWRHWVIPGLKSSGPGLPVLKTKPATTTHLGPSPGAGTGLHRYVFLLFQETAPYTVPQDAIENSTNRDDRRSWDLSAFVEKYSLKLVGANYFLCKKTEN